MPIMSGPTPASIALEIGGKHGGWLQRVQPPGYEALKVAASVGEPGSVRNAGIVTPTPANADFAFAGPGPLFDWAMTLPRRSPLTLDGAIQVCDHNHRVVRRIEWSQGLLTELRLPELDATSKAAFTLGLSWQPQAIRFSKAGTGTAAPAIGQKKALLLSSFRVNGLPFDAASVVRVALPTVRAKLAVEANGAVQRRPSRHVAGIDLGEVRLEIGARSADAVRDWVAKVVGDGTLTDAERIDFDIELLDPSLKKVLATISLRACALTGYAEFELGAGAQRPANVALRFSVGELDMKAVA